jgi:hypothetical protein
MMIEEFRSRSDNARLAQCMRLASVRAEIFAALAVALCCAPVRGATAREPFTSSPLCLFVQELARHQLAGGEFDFVTSGSHVQPAGIIQGHTAALVAAFSANLCGSAPAGAVARKWIEWVHANSADTTVPSAMQPPWMEAARYLRLVAAARRHLPPPLFRICTQRAEAALGRLASWQDADGLVWSDAARTHKHLLDNIEAWLALRSAATILRDAGSKGAAASARSRADQLYEAIETKLWCATAGRYAWDIESSGTLQTRAERWDPDMVSQLAAVAFLPPNTSLRALYADLLAGLGSEDSRLAWPRDVELVAWFALAARNAGAGESWGRFMKRLDDIPQSLCESIPLDVWLVIALAAQPPA